MDGINGRCYAIYIFKRNDGFMVGGRPVVL